MMYEYKCSKGHITTWFCSYEERKERVPCHEKCGHMAERIYTPVGVVAGFPYGKRFEHVDDGKREFKNHAELDAYLDKNKLCVRDAGLTDQAKKVRAEDRAHARLRGKGSSTALRQARMKLPEKVDKAFRESPTVESAVKALKEGRV